MNNIPPITECMEVFPVQDIYRAVAEVYDVTLAEIASRQKTQGVAHARHCLMWALRKFTIHTYQRIADLLDRTDHTTIMHGIRQHRIRMETDPRAAAMTAMVLDILRSGGRR